MRNEALPGNPRYQPKSLVPIFGYDNLVSEVAAVELAGIQVLADIGVIPANEIAQMTPEMKKQILSITTTAVEELERSVTKHDIRALVRLIQDILPQDLRRWVHVPFTSYDPLATGRILQYSRAEVEVITPKVKEVIGILAKLVRKYANTLQIGRTHGQHALPITVGFWLATILSRLMYNSQQIYHYSGGFAGKISGAVGTNNAVFGLGIEEKSMAHGGTFQQLVLAKLGLNPVRISTQILPPEPTAYFLFSNLMLSATFGQFARDGRHLMRSEIGEVVEAFGEGQVGSSTMAHKRNPMTLENIEGMWQRNQAEFGKVLLSMISEHQRDLVGSSLERDFPIMLVNLVVQMDSLLRIDEKTNLNFLERMTINEDMCMKNFAMSADFILAEPIYIALQMAGYTGDAHELVNRQAIKLRQQVGGSLMNSVRVLADTDGALAEALKNIPAEVALLLDRPESYVGNASAQALMIAETAEAYVATRNPVKLSSLMS